VLLESGINHLGGMAGLGRLRRPQPTLIPLSGSPATERARERVEVVGPLCTTLDSLGSDVDAPVLQAGDYVAIPNAGAYGVSASLTGFLSRPSPLELVSDDGKLVAAYRLRTGHQTVPLAELARTEAGAT
jgi:diaminopimelate decarboxylase